MASRLPLLAPALATLAFLSAQAQEILRIQLLKDVSYAQTSTADPTPIAVPYEFRAKAVPVLKSLVVGNPVLRSPANVDFPMPWNANEESFLFRQTAATSGELAAFGTGEYTLAFTGTLAGEQTATITFSEGAFPPPPKVSNFSAAQAVDASADFTLQWQAPGNADLADRVELRIADAGGVTVFETPAFTETDSLAGTETSFVLWADMLEKGQTYQATLTFYKIAGANELLLPFWTTAYSARTTFPLKTKGDGGGGPDTTPPVLVNVTPESGHVFTETNQLSFPLVFRFDEAMAATASIAWSAGIDGTKVTNFWSPDGLTLICGYPGGWPALTTVTWTLNPTAGNAGNFRNTIGLELAANTFKGSFTTGPGETAPGPCDGNDGVPFSILKTVNYQQETDGTLALDLTKRPSFAAVLTRTGSVTANVTLEVAGTGRAEELSGTSANGVTHKLFATELDTLSELDAAFPAGDYLLKEDGTTTSSAKIKVAAGIYPAVPRFLNLPVANAAALESDLTVQWEPFTGAGTVALEISKADGTIVFRAPDACANRTLPPSSGSVVVPHGTFAVGIDYWVRLTFVSVTDQKAFPGSTGSGVSGLARTTTVSLKRPANIELPANYLKFTGPKVNGAEMRFDFVGAPGRQYQLEASTGLEEPIEWTRLTTREAGTNSITWVNPDGQDFPRRYFRVREVPLTGSLIITNGPVRLDAERRVSEIANDGLKLHFTAQNGDGYSFELPENSVMFKERLGFGLATRLEGLPFAAGLLAAADVSRWDLEFFDAATLKVQFAAVPPAQLVAFGFNPLTHEYFLMPHRKTDREASVSVAHGGVVGFAVATSSEVATLRNFTPANFSDRLAHASGLAQFQAAADSGAAARMSIARAGVPWQDYKTIYDNQIRPGLLQAISSHDPYSGLSPYRQWWLAAVNDDAAANLIVELQDGNALAVALIENETTYLEPLVRAHEHDAILKLQLLRSYIAKDPWQNGFAPGQKQALYDRIRNLLRAEFEFETTLRTEFPDLGVLQIRLQSKTVFYFAGDPRDHKQFKGVSPLTFMERTHYPVEPPCTVQVGAPGTGNLELVNSWFHGHGTGTGTGLNRRWLITDMSIAAFPYPILEGFTIVCPTANFPVTYWWPQFAKFHEDEIRRHRLADGFERMAFDFERSWYVRPSGNAVLATRRHDRDMNIDGAIVHELTLMRVTHSPL